MKKLIQSVSVFMAATILLQSAFCWLIVFFLWNHTIHEQKKKMEHSIPIEKLTAISFRKNRNAVRMNEKEIKVNGEWYDIVYKTGKGENEIFYCISDKKESEIMASLENDKSNPAQQGLVSFMKSLSKEYPLVHSSFSPCLNFTVNIYLTETEKKILSGYCNIIYSPPDFIA